jgi:hypothetical protein
MRRAVAALVGSAALVVLAVPPGATAQLLPEPPPKAELATTGNDSELLATVPIGTSVGAEDRTVMSLGPDNLKRIRRDDTMRVSGEVQISTTCVAEDSRCQGRPYQFNPKISARIVLAASAAADAPSIPLSNTADLRCKQRRPNRNHHCTLALPNVATQITDPGSLPCEATACYANLILSASNKRARPGNVVVLGADRPDGGVAQDKGRLNVVQAREETPPPTEQSTSDLVNSSLPLTEGKKEKRRVIHSIPIAAPLKGEVLAFDGSWTATIDQLPFNTFIATRVIVSDDPASTDPSGLATNSVQFGGDATETNGFNCTQGPSGFPSPCTSVKAGAVRITQDVIDPATGAPGTLYLNLVGAAKPLLAKRVKRSQQVMISAAGGLRVFRYGL